MTTRPEMSVDPRLVLDAPGLKGLVRGARRRLGQGDLGNLPVVIALVVIWGIFSLANPRFLSAVNLTNLMLQIAATGTISVGLVLVLLLGEIDLSAGATSGLAAAVMAVLNVKMGFSATPALAAGILVGAAIGLFQGLWIVRLRVPSFVVTLAGLLGWQGALLYVLGDTGTLNLNDRTIIGLAGSFFPPAVGWSVAAAALAIYGASLFERRRRRAKLGLPVAPVWNPCLRVLVAGAVLAAAILVFTMDRGLPLAVVLFVGIVVLVDLATRRTRFGRHVFAVGGSAEAARRAGIDVGLVRVVIFALGGALAAAGGILASSRLMAVNQSSGSGDILLNAIAAAVIGGTSLFGGRGSAWSALLGSLVIGSVSNGMDLLALPSSVKFMVTGGVLLVAASIDAISRRGRQAAGRA